MTRTDIGVKEFFDAFKNADKGEVIDTVMDSHSIKTTFENGHVFKQTSEELQFTLPVE